MRTSDSDLFLVVFVLAEEAGNKMFSSRCRHPLLQLEMFRVNVSFKLSQHWKSGGTERVGGAPGPVQ